MSSVAITVIAAGVVSYILTCWAMLDVAKKSFASLEEKIAWGVVAFIPFVGWIVYALVGRNRGNRPGPGIS